MNYNALLNEIIFDTKTYSFNFENLTLSLITERTFPEEMRAAPDLVYMHAHTYYELFSVRKGTLSIVFENGKEVIRANDVLIIPPGTKHSVEQKSSSSIGVDLNFSIVKNQLDSSVDLYSALINALNSNYIILRFKPDMVNLLSKISEAVSNSNYAYKIGVYLYDFLTDFIYLSNDLTMYEPDTNELFSVQPSERTMQIHRILNMTYRKKLSFSYIADRLHLSTRQLNRIIQKIYGCTYTRKITSMRMEEALVLLKNPRFTSITEIAEYLGYDSKNTFKKAFENFYGYTVDEYLNKNKISEKPPRQSRNKRV